MKARPDGPGALDLVEEATHLVRTVPAAVGAAYGLGVVPFLLAAIFFIADMSRGVHAATHLPGAALGLVVAFAWMKAWQAVAAEGALAFLEQRAPERLGIAGFAGLALRQFSLHAFGLVLLPLAGALLLPGAWAYAYYQNATVLGVSAGRRIHKVAGEQARLWPAQNHLALGAVAILSLLVLANIGIALYTVPWLVRTITGTERVFAQIGWNPFNTTFVAAVCALGFLVLDPVLKAFYVLRCFYGQSRRTGVDLLVQVRAALARGAMIVAFALVFLGTDTHASGAGDELPDTGVERAGASSPDVVSPRSLEEALERVLEQPEYVWREPVARPEGVISDVVRWINSLSTALARWWRDLFETDEDDGRDGLGAGFFGFGGTFFWVLLVVIAVGVVAVIVMLILKHKEAAAGAPAPSVGVTKVPALDREDLTADQLEEEEWMRLARELIARGDVRLGMRALFLGSLAGLAARGLVVLARHKSNRDYERELLRRGASLGAVLPAFVENRREFEGVWYGGSHPGDASIARFELNVKLLVRRDAA